MSRRPRACWGLFGAVALASSCQSKSVEPEKVGTALTPGDERVTVARWSADGSEIDYLALSPTGTSLKAAKVDGSGVRVLDDTKAAYWSLFTSPDGSSLYYTAAETLDQTEPQRFLYEALRMKRLDAVTLDRTADVLAAAPDGHHIAVWSAGVLHEVNLDDGTARDLAIGMPPLQQTAGNVGDLTYSPAGDKLFFLTGGPGNFTGSIIDVATQTSERRPLTQGNFPLPSWTNQGLRILSSTARVPLTLLLEDFATGEVHAIAWQAPHSLDGGTWSWSHDGSRIAAIDAWCTSGDVLTCSAVESALYVVEVATGHAALVARSSAGIWLAEFSRDDSRIAYAAGLQLYVADVPR